MDNINRKNEVIQILINYIKLKKGEADAAKYNS